MREAVIKSKNPQQLLAEIEEIEKMGKQEIILIEANEIHFIAIETAYKNNELTTICLATCSYCEIVKLVIKWPA